MQTFDARGSRLATAGRSGGGPGEFRAVTSACRTRGDTVLVSDDIE
ncbi:MAG: hypothetical protein ACO1Q7_19870 [Gemmatimonas sp.]